MTAHVIATTGDKFSLCGVRDPYPRVLARFVEAHVNGHGMSVCPECEGASRG